jgi:hypothetical protein
VLRDGNGNNQRILSIPQGYPEYERLEDCTALGIERVEIGATIMNLQFMRNIRVSLIIPQTAWIGVTCIRVSLAVPG